MTEHRVYQGGYNTYGRALGVMMLDTRTPRPPGDVGNARSYDYPVSFEVVERTTPIQAVRDLDPALLEPFERAAHNLVERGVVAITTNCGFLLTIQDELANRVGEVPVFTSSLLQIPVVEAMISDDQQIGVLTADERSFERLDHAVLTQHADRLEVEGLAESDPFQAVLVERTSDVIDLDEVGDDVVAAARRLVDENQIGAIIFECTNLRPYVDRVQRETGLPVFDYLTLADMAWRAAKGTRY